MAARWVWMAWKRAGASISRSMINLHTFLLSNFTCGRKSQCSTAYTTSVPRPRAIKCTLPKSDCGLQFSVFNHLRMLTLQHWLQFQIPTTETQLPTDSLSVVGRTHLILNDTSLGELVQPLRLGAPRQCQPILDRHLNCQQHHAAELAAQHLRAHVMPMSRFAEPTYLVF
jgi:hypothetical protein